MGKASSIWNELRHTAVISTAEGTRLGTVSEISTDATLCGVTEEAPRRFAGFGQMKGTLVLAAVQSVLIGAAKTRSQHAPSMEVVVTSETLPKPRVVRSKKKRHQKKYAKQVARYETGLQHTTYRNCTIETTAEHASVD